MAQIIFDRGGKRLYIHVFFDAEHFTSGEEPYARSRNSEWATGVEGQLHAAGITSARAVLDASLAPIGAGFVEASPVSEAINWDGVPWRITPVRTGDGRYSYSFHDPITNTQQSVIGSSPQDVVDRLRIEHPIYTRHIETLPVYTPAPVAPPPAPVEAGPIRILRHADQTETLPERRLPEKPRVSSRDFERYVDSLSNEEFKQKMKDPDFARAVDALPQKKWQ
jgi:hypothetical protein